MYTYNKNDKSYTFSSDDLNIEELLNNEHDKTNLNDVNSIEENLSNNNLLDSNIEETNKSHKRIEVINGGNDLDISPVSDYIEIEKPKKEKKENVIIPEDKED